MRIYVGNLSYEVTEDDLRKEFSSYGEVTSVSVVTDRYSGRSKGFAFVEMNTKAEADAAIAALNGKALKDRTLVVNEARPRTEGGGRSGGGGGYGGGGGGYGDKRGGGGSGGGYRDDKRGGGGRGGRQGGRY